MSAGLSSSELIQGLLDSFEEPTPAPHDMASEPIPDSSQAKAEVPAAFQHLEDDATALKRMRLETQDMLQLIGTEKLNDSVVKALRLWMCSTHPYAVVQQWEHALDTLAIRGAATKEGADTLTRAKSAMTDWYHRVKFGVTGSSRAPDAKEELAKLQRGGKAGAGAAPMPKLDEDEASAFAGANGTSEAETQGGDTQPAHKQRSLSITLDSPVHCAAEGEEGPSPLLLAARDLHTLDAVIRTTQWARIDRRLAGRDRGVPLAVGPDVRPDMYVLLMRPDSVGFAATHSSSSDRAATSSQDGQEGVGHSVAAAAAAAGKARSGSTAGGAKAGSRSSISLPIGPSVSTLRPERDHKGRPLTTEVLPELPGLARGTVGAWAQSTPPHMLPVVEDQLPPQPAVVPVPGALIPVPALQEASHPVTLTNIGRAKAKISFRVTQAHPPASASVHVEPPAIVVRRGESVTVQVIVHVVSPGVDVSAIILGEDERGARVPLCVRCLASPQVFAVPLRKLVMVQDCGLRVPAVLRALRQALEATGGYAAEGIFRLAPGDSMVKTVRAALDSGRYIPPSPLASAGVIPAEGVVNATSRDVAAAAEAATRAAMEGQGLVPAHALSSATCYTAAHVIKILYRNLPCRVLQNVPSTVLAGAKTQEAALRVVKEFVKPPHTDLLWWLVQLLTRVAEGAAWTKMTAKNCAIVAAPNLCAVEADENPMEALLLSQQTTMLLTHLIEFKLSQRSAIATPGGGEGEADGGALSRELAELAKGPTFLKALLPVAEQTQEAASSPSDAAAPPSRLPASSLGEMAVPPARSAGSTGSPDSDATGHRHHLHRASTSVASYTNEELQQALAGIRTSTSADGGGEVSPPQERPPPLAPRPPSLPPPPHLNQAAIQVPAQQPESERSSPELDGQQPAAPVPPMIPPPPPQQQAGSGGQAPPASHATGRMAPPSGAPPPPMASNTNLTQGDGPPPPPTQAEDMPPPPPPMPDSEATPSETQGDEPAPLAGSPPKPAQAGGREVDEALETYETHAVPPPEQTAEALDASEVHFELPSLEQVGEVGARSTAAAAPGDLQMPQAETGVETEAAVHPEEAECGESAGKVETVADALDESAADAAAAAPASASPHAPVFEADAEGDTLHDATSAEQAMDGNVAEVAGTDALRSDSESAAGAGEEGVNFFGDAADDSSEASADG